MVLGQLKSLQALSSCADVDLWLTRKIAAGGGHGPRTGEQLVTGGSGFIE
jgi:hypothetical protein